MNLTLSKIQDSVGALVGGNNSYAVTLIESKNLEERVRYFVNRHADVINDALHRLGYGNIQAISDNERLLPRHNSLTDVQDIDLTVRHVELISSGQHFQLGDINGDFLWEPYYPPAHVNVQSVLNYRIVRFKISN